MKRSTIIFAAVFILSLVSSLGQGFFYWPQASPVEGGTVKSSIALRAEDVIVEHYQAVPQPGYIFDSWSLYPRGKHAENLYVHTYDPRLFYTQEIKPITAHFVKADTFVESKGKDLEIRRKEGNQMELTIFSQRGVSYSIHTSSNMQDWAMIGEGDGNGEEQLWTFPIQMGDKVFYRLLKLGGALNQENAVFGELRFIGLPLFEGGISPGGATAWVRLWEYDPRIADKGADLFAEQIVEEIPSGAGTKRFRFELGEISKANSDRSYYITAAIYEKGRVGDVNARIHFLDGFNTVDIPSEFSAELKPYK